MMFEEWQTHSIELTLIIDDDQVRVNDESLSIGIQVNNDRVQ